LIGIGFEDRFGCPQTMERQSVFSRTNSPYRIGQQYSYHYGVGSNVLGRTFFQILNHTMIRNHHGTNTLYASREGQLACATVSDLSQIVSATGQAYHMVDLVLPGLPFFFFQSFLQSIFFNSGRHCMMVISWQLGDFQLSRAT
jgi:hypothetical protein